MISLQGSSSKNSFQDPKISFSRSTPSEQPLESDSILRHEWYSDSNQEPCSHFTTLPKFFLSKVIQFAFNTSFKERNRALLTAIKSHLKYQNKRSEIISAEYEEKLINSGVSVQEVKRIYKHAIPIDATVTHDLEKESESSYEVI